LKVEDESELIPMTVRSSSGLLERVCPVVRESDMKYKIVWSQGGYEHTVYGEIRQGIVLAAEAISVGGRAVAVNTETKAERLFFDGFMQWTDSEF
jgi:hypothetical protein